MGFKGIFKTAFPFISAAVSIGGPLGTMAAHAIGKTLGVDEKTVSVDNIGDAIAAAVSKDPEAMLKLKQTEQDFQLKMAELGYDSVAKLEEIAANDRANARAREIAVRDKTPMIIAFVVVIATLFLEGYVVIHGIPALTPDTAVIIGRVLGTLDSATVLVLGYYFGSSSGSEKKTEMLGKQS